MNDERVGSEIKVVRSAMNSGHKQFNFGQLASYQQELLQSQKRQLLWKCINQKCLWNRSMAKYWSCNVLIFVGHKIIHGKKMNRNAVSFLLLKALCMRLSCNLVSNTAKKSQPDLNQSCKVHSENEDVDENCRQQSWDLHSYI